MPTLGDTVDAQLVNANFEPVLKDPTYRSDFTGRIVAVGRGTSLATIDARIRAESAPSSAAGRSWQHLYLDGAIANRGVLTLDTLLVGWGPSGGSTATSVDLGRVTARLRQGPAGFVESSLPLSSSERTAFASSAELLATSGVVDLRNGAVPTYDLNGYGRNFDLSRITLDPTQSSSLTFTLLARGTGNNPDRMIGTATLSTAKGSFNGQAIPPVDATIALANEPANDGRSRSNQTSPICRFRGSGVSPRWCRRCRRD